MKRGSHHSNTKLADILLDDVVFNWTVTVLARAGHDFMRTFLNRSMTAAERGGCFSNCVRRAAYGLDSTEIHRAHLARLLSQRDLWQDALVLRESNYHQGDPLMKQAVEKAREELGEDQVSFVLLRQRLHEANYAVSRLNDICERLASLNKETVNVQR